MNKDDLKNILDTHIVSELISDNVLLIFNNYAELLKYRRKNKYMTPDQIFITIDDLYNSNKLDGLRYKRYVFMENK